MEPTAGLRPLTRPRFARSTSPQRERRSETAARVSTLHAAVVSLKEFRGYVARGGDHEHHEIFVASFLEAVFFAGRHVDDVAGFHRPRLDCAGGVLAPRWPGSALDEEQG